MSFEVLAPSGLGERVRKVSFTTNGEKENFNLYLKNCVSDSSQGMVVAEFTQFKNVKTPSVHVFQELERSEILFLSTFTFLISTMENKGKLQLTVARSSSCSVSTPNLGILSALPRD